jgi:hypothetical protein
MVESKIGMLISRLHTKTRASRVEWKETENPTAFQVSFSGYSVRIVLEDETGYVADGADPYPSYKLSIFNDQDCVVESVSDCDFTGDAEALDQLQVLRELYEGARHKAMGVEDAFNTIMSELEDDPLDGLPF